MQEKKNQNNDTPLEIERKFLIRYPDLTVLEKVCTGKTAISQTYLTSAPGITRRIRTMEKDGEKHYIYTYKEKITDITRVEKEKEITKEEYDLLMKEARPDSRTINKVRYYLPSGDLCFEIDIFPEWSDRAFAEVEMEAEDQQYIFPDILELIKEVTSDSRYTNASLAANGFVYDEID